MQCVYTIVSGNINTKPLEFYFNDKNHRNHLKLNMMKQKYFITFLILMNICQNNYSQNEINDTNKIDSILITPEKFANFPGGDIELLSFIERNINKEIVGDTNLKEGKVFVSFNIDTIGNLKDFKILKSYNQAIDNEFLRVLKLMPNWIPGVLHVDNMNGHWKRIPNTYNMSLKIPFNGYNLNKEN